MPTKVKFSRFQMVQVVDDEGLDVPDHLRGKIGTVVEVYDDNTYDVQFKVEGEVVNFTYYQIENPTL